MCVCVRERERGGEGRECVSETERQRREVDRQRGGHRNTSVFRVIPQQQTRFIGALGSRFRL